MEYADTCYLQYWRMNLYLKTNAKTRSKKKTKNKQTKNKKCKISIAKKLYLFSKIAKNIEEK
jgi:hypothetical protein